MAEPSEIARRNLRGLFKAIFGGAPAAAGIVDSSGRWLETNQSLQSASGRTAEALAALDLSSILLPPSGDVILRQLANIMRLRSRSIEADVSVLRANGSLTSGFLQVFPFPSGATDTFLALLTDVSGHRPFRAVVEQSSLCVFIYGDDGLEYVNPKFAECFGYQREEIAPDSLARLVIDADREEMMKALTSILDGRKDAISATARMRTREGTILPMELRAAASQYEGRRAAIGTAVDITTRVREREKEMLVQSAVEHAAREWRMIFDAVETPLIVAHADGRVDRINRAARMIAGTSYDEIIGQPISKIGTEQPWTLVADLIATVSVSREPLPGHVTDPLGRTWDLFAVPFDTSNPDDDRVNVVAWDVTQVVELQSQLDSQATMAAMGSLLGGVAHEVRNPLFAISATLDALEDSSGGAHAEYFAVLRAEIERMTRLMQDLLTFGRPAAPQFEKADLETTIDAAITLSQPLARERNVTIVKRVRSAPMLLIDRERITRMLQNLIANAVQHSGAKSRVIVEGGRGRARAATYEVRVLDRGPGFRDEDIPRVFDPFFSRRKGGTGLGLAIVEQIATEHQGTIAIANRPGGGAIVTVSLPLPANAAKRKTRRK